MQRHTLAWATLATLTLIAFASAPAMGQSGATVDLLAKESGCSGGKTFCFDVELTGTIEPGSTVTFNVEVASSAASPHNAYVTVEDDYDTDHTNTDSGAAEGNTADLDPGESASFTVEVPDDATELYYWCDVSGHETLGMWGTLAVGGSMTDGGDGMDGGDGDDGNETSDSPNLGVLAILAGTALAAFALRRRD